MEQQPERNEQADSLPTRTAWHLLHRIREAWGRRHRSGTGTATGTGTEAGSGTGTAQVHAVPGADTRFPGEHRQSPDVGTAQKALAVP